MCSACDAAEKPLLACITEHMWLFLLGSKSLLHKLNGNSIYYINIIIVIVVIIIVVIPAADR